MEADTKKPAAKQATKSPNLTRPLLAAQFHTGVTLGSVTTTGVNAAALRLKGLTLQDMRLVPAGVWIKVQDREYVVPFSNVLRVEIEVEGEAA